LLAAWDGPILIGGEFSLKGKANKKTVSSINEHWTNFYNNWANKFDMTELKEMLVECILTPSDCGCY
jgi:hypothetical protein